MSWIAYVDESQSDRSRDPDTYILAAAVADATSLDPARQAMLSLRIGRGGKVHWRDEGPARRMSIVSTIGGLELEHLVVVRSGHAAERGERRRRLCLEYLCQELASLGVEKMVLESRGPRDDRRDLNALQAFRAKKIVDSSLRMDHLPGPAEPMLWIADAVCGAVVAARTRTDAYFRKIESSCTVLPLG